MYITPPKAKTEYVESFGELRGGLNLSEPDYRLRKSESPEMENLVWRDGALTSRDGQTALTPAAPEAPIAMHSRLFHGCIVAHCGTALYAIDPMAAAPVWTQLTDGIRSEKGTFYLYNNILYYKTVGSYTAVSFDSENGVTAGAVVPYVPVTVINASPSDGAGDLYQSENRLSAAKTVWYNAAAGERVYHLPVKDIDSVDSVEVDGVTLSEGYTVDAAGGTVTFASAPPVTDPPTNNTVRIRYRKENPEAEKSILDCRYAALYGGTGTLCIVLAGSAAQPNAYFWNANSALGMEAGYFPMEQVQLAGGAEDAVTGFGKQQSYLIVFKEHSVGRTQLNTVTLNGKTALDLPYTAINDKLGCDRPWSIELIENNLVWCDSRRGVMLLKDSSSALENNVECISRKVNGSAVRPGLLADAAGGEVFAFDDGSRYWLCAGGHVWAWDYEASLSADPAWFYWTGIDPVGLLEEAGRVLELHASGCVAAFSRCYEDFGRPIRKVYRFAALHFGGYDRLKNVNSVILAVRGDTNGRVALRYISDHGEREDAVPIESLNWMLSPRDLRFRALSVPAFAQVIRRRPMCRHVRHFSMQLENAELGQDLSIVGAQIFYNFQGRQR